MSLKTSTRQALTAEDGENAEGTQILDQGFPSGTGPDATSVSLLSNAMPWCVASDLVTNP